MASSDELNFMNRSMHKHLKEEFVSNLSGTSMPEVAALSFLFPALLLLSKCHPYFEVNSTKQMRTHWHWSLIGEFIFVVIPTISILTVLNGKVFLLTAVVACGVAVVFLQRRRYLRANSTSFEDNNSTQLPKLHFISSYRFIVMLVTCLSILGVDFNVFPRRYAKTETYGTSLMDVGVGSFVMMNALVSKKSRGLSTIKRRGAVVQTIGPLLVLGIARLLFTKQVDYQVHVGEYGVHWNFFFTLAAVALLTSFVDVPVHLSGILGIAILLVHQACLLGGLNSYLNSAERGGSLISQNKEGIFSLAGYLGLYLLGMHLGYFLFQLNEGRSSFKKPIVTAIILFLCLLSWLLAVLSDHVLEKTSRRSCNLAFAFFILAVNLEGLAVLALAELLSNIQPLLIERVFTENMLATFLLANLLTGLVNLSINTIFVSASMAYITILLYSLTLIAGMFLINNLKLRFKF